MGKRKAKQGTGEDLRAVLQEKANLPLKQQEHVLHRMGHQG